MSVWPLLKGDFRFQWKYGFYGLYLLFSVLYTGALLAIPASVRQTAAILMIFSDPAAIGLFFLGAMVLFEQSQHVVSSLAVAPITTLMYVLSKLLSLAAVSTVVALVIAVFGGYAFPVLSFVAGVFLGSMLFCAVGMILAARTVSLNRFLLSTIPAELLITLPAMAYLLGWQPDILLLHPGVSMLILLKGGGAFIALPVLLLWTAGFFFLAVKAADRMFLRMGGGAA